METHLDPYGDHSPAVVDLGTVRPLATRRSAVRTLRREKVDSPTTTVRQMLKALGVSSVAVLLLCSQGIIQNARGMQPGPSQAVIFSVGNIGFAVEEFLHLTWPWNDFQAAIGHPQQPSGGLLQAPPPPAKPHPTAAPPEKNKKGHQGKGKKPTGGHKPPPAPTWPAIRAVTKSHPLELLITGDSLVGYMGPQILNQSAAQGPVRGTTDTHDGTGLTTPAFHDWSFLAGQQVETYHPDAVVIMIGGNDFENMTWPPSKAYPQGRFFTAGTKTWMREYQRRAEIVMRKWIHGGVRRVYWLSLPPAQNPSWAHDDRQIDLALRHAAADVPGARYLNILGPIMNHGHYAAYVKIGGVPTLIRESDGVHLNSAGSQLVANEVVPVIKREWRFGWSQVRDREHGGHKNPRPGTRPRHRPRVHAR